MITNTENLSFRLTSESTTNVSYIKLKARIFSFPVVKLPRIILNESNRNSHSKSITVEAKAR